MNVFKGRFCTYLTGCQYATDPDFYHVNSGKITLDYNCVVQRVESLVGVCLGGSGLGLSLPTCKVRRVFNPLVPSI